MTEFVEISKGTVSHLSSTHYCQHCGTDNDVELAFVAHSVWESPDLLATLSDADRLRIISFEQAGDISRRLDISNPHAPLLICEQCGLQSCLQVRHEVHSMTALAFVWCSCGQEVDLRYPADSNRIRFTSQFPSVPFLRCRSCNRKMLIPLCGKDTWRVPVFRIIRFLRRFIF